MKYTAYQINQAKTNATTERGAGYVQWLKNGMGRMTDFESRPRNQAWYADYAWLFETTSELHMLGLPVSLERLTPLLNEPLPPIVYDHSRDLTDFIQPILRGCQNLKIVHPMTESWKTRLVNGQLGRVGARDLYTYVLCNTITDDLILNGVPGIEGLTARLARHVNGCPVFHGTGTSIHYQMAERESLFNSAMMLKKKIPMTALVRFPLKTIVGNGVSIETGDSSGSQGGTWRPFLYTTMNGSDKWWVLNKVNMPCPNLRNGFLDLVNLHKYPTEGTLTYVAPKVTQLYKSMVFRANDVALVIQLGPNNEGHDHDDVGGVAIYHNGWKLPFGGYPATWAGKATNEGHPYAHSLPTVDGMSPSKEAVATVTTDAATVYINVPDYVRGVNLTREITVVNNTTIVDYIKLTSESVHTYQMRYSAPLSSPVTVTGNVLELNNRLSI